MEVDGEGGSLEVVQMGWVEAGVNQCQREE